MSPSTRVSTYGLPLSRLLILALLLGAAARGGAQSLPPEDDADWLARAQAIHGRVLSLDSHVDIPFDFATPAHDPATALAQVNLDGMRAGGLDAAFFIVYVGQGERSPAGYAAARRDALTKFEAIARMTTELYPERIGLADSAADLRALRAEGRLAALIGIENGYVIGRDLALLEDFRRRGARYLTLVHNGHNDIGDSAQPQARLGDASEEHGGLSDFGFRVVEELNRLGILVDVSHVSKATMLDATRHSRAPVIASHSAVAAVHPHPRNMDDEQLLALRDNGGVLQVVAFDSYLRPLAPEKTAALAALRERFGLSAPDQAASLDAARLRDYEDALAEIERQWPAADDGDLVDHIDHAVQLIGAEHVGISSDFGGGGGVSGWNAAAESHNVTLELLRRGYSEQDIAALWGGNVLRLLEQADTAAEFVLDSEG